QQVQRCVAFNEQIFGAGEQLPRWLRALSKKCIWTRELRKRQKKGSARPVTQSGRAEYRDIRPALLTAPSQQWLGLFPSMAATNKSLAQTNKSLDRIGATKERHTPPRPGGIGIFFGPGHPR